MDKVKDLRNFQKQCNNSKNLSNPGVYLPMYTFLYEYVLFYLTLSKNRFLAVGKSYPDC
jgi:hypothetical protein